MPAYTQNYALMTTADDCIRVQARLSQRVGTNDTPWKLIGVRCHRRGMPAGSLNIVMNVHDVSRPSSRRVRWTLFVRLSIRAPSHQIDAGALDTGIRDPAALRLRVRTLMPKPTVGYRGSANSGSRASRFLESTWFE